MLGASKILTVSYGTFSCTLEGFDEPFNTMKAIAEYFRDLAAEDRYFGAEPPTPDAAMLHKIAEREIQRRVEAKIQDNGVILRAETGETPRRAPPPLAAPPAPALANAVLQDGSGESLSARLSRLRANHPAEDAPTEAADDPVAAPLAVTPDLPPEPATDPSADSLPTVPAGQRLTQTSTLLDDDYTEDQHAGEMGPDILARVEALTAKAPSDAQAELVAEPAPAPDAKAAQDLTTPAQTAQDEAAETEALLAQLCRQTLDPPAVPEVTPPAVTAAMQEPDAMTASSTFDLSAEPAKAAGALASDADTEALLADLALQTEPEDVAAEAAPPEPAAAIEQTALAPESQAPEARIDAPPEPEPPRPQTAEEALAEALGIDAPEARAMIGKPDSAPVPENPPLPEAAPQDITRARVIRVRRIEPASPQQPPRDSVLSQDAEAALMSELAALQSPEPAAADPAPTEAVRPTRPVRVLRPDPNSATPKILVQTVSGSEAADLRQGLTDLSKDDAVNRLIAQTNSALDGPEARRRSVAISHLKAAVAATEAERRLQDGSPTPQEDRKSAYRDDLDSVVRPNPAANRMAERPGPLVLVSEQRIDRAKPAPTPLTAGRVMPTRLVPAGLQKPSPEGLIGGDLDDEDDDALLTAEEASANLFTEGTSFADFAEQLGAQSLHDLLEASAVYCAQVLGRPQFSRPLVMSQINTLPNAEKHRLEDQLRAFGTLMREGRIKKVKRGGFAITDRSPLLAEALRNAG